MTQNNTIMNHIRQQDVRKNVLGETNSLDSGSSPIVIKNHILADSLFNPFMKFSIFMMLILSIGLVSSTNGTLNISDFNMPWENNTEGPIDFTTQNISASLFTTGNFTFSETMYLGELVKGDLVLDPFIGLGSTAVACKRLKRNFIGIEIEQEYIDIANSRLSQNTLESQHIVHREPTSSRVIKR